MQLRTHQTNGTNFKFNCSLNFGPFLCETAATSSEEPLSFLESYVAHLMNFHVTLTAEAHKRLKSCHALVVVVGGASFLSVFFFSPPACLSACTVLELGGAWG